MILTSSPIYLPPVIYSKGWKPGLAQLASSSRSQSVVTAWRGPQAPAIVISVLTTVSIASGAAFLILAAFSWPRSEKAIGTVALTPVPTIRPAATLELGNDLTLYARAANVAMVSFVIAAILRRGSGPNLRRFERGEDAVGDCRRVCREYPSSKVEPRSRSEVIVNPFTHWHQRG